MSGNLTEVDKFMKRKSGTDLKSKLILLKAEITNLIIKKFIGTPTEWPNLMKSDVVYEPFAHKDRHLPPILIEIQHTVDLHSTTQDILEIAVKEDPEVPFAARTPCAGWAQLFYLLSLISMERRGDPTIQLLFKYTKHIIFNGDIGKHDNILDAFDTVSNQFHRQLIKAKRTLAEDINNKESRKRTAQVLEDGILFVNEMRKKHSLSSDSSTALSSSSTISFTASSTNSDLLPIV
ncbi:hypothetical protein BDA99DRAFT_560901 [Phascolomyces articulosus]|uniref:Uncharacterized protein n=1 Tax=Phascolomyces articulosus TaxID=60185 RepID=A0AAD5PCM9_9FUNG|nr:hypothetical protein BDA99DRAFT_560901 [Phascolomyces articulosus]